MAIRNAFNERLRSVLTGVLAIALAAAPLAACGKGSASDDATGPKEQQVESVSDAPADPDAAAGQNAPEDQGAPLPTPAGELSCPESWGEDVQVKDNTSDGQGRIDFTATGDNGPVTLFSLVFGDSGQGHELGTAPGANGSPVKVSLIIDQIQEGDGVSAETAQNLSALQDGVNDILDQLYGVDGFEAMGN